MSGHTEKDSSSDKSPDLSRGVAGKRDGDAPNQDQNVVRKGLRRLSRHIRVWPVVWRAVLYGLLSVAMVITLAALALRSYVTSDRVEHWIEDLVRQETGGKVEIGEVRVNILTGLSLGSVKFFPPVVPEQGWSGDGIRHHKKAAFECEKIDIGYSLLGILAGQINIKAFKIFDPKIRVDKEGATSNLDGIASYRQTLPKDAASAEVQDERSNDRALKAVLGNVSPGLLYMPLRVIVRNIGVQNLVFESQERLAGGLVQVTRLAGMSVDVAASWHQVKSRLGMIIGSLQDTPIVYSRSHRRVDSGAEKDVVDLSAQAFVLAELAVEDLKQIELKLASRLDQMIPDRLHGREFSLGVDTKLGVIWDKMQVDLRRFSVEIPEAMTFDAQGDVRLIDLESKSIAVNIVQNANLHLDALVRRIEPLVGGIKASGTVDIDNLSIHGVINPQDVENLLAGQGPSPTVSGAILLDDLHVEMQKPDIKVDGLNGSLKFGGARALTGGGFGLDDLLQLSLDSISLTQEVAAGDTVTIEARDVGVESAARLVWPRMQAQMARLSVSAEQMKAGGKKIRGWNAPMYLEVTADGDQDLSRNTAALNLEWKGLFELSGGLDCHARCSRFRADLRHRLETLEGLYGAIGGLLGPNVPAMFRPEKLAGSLDVQLALQGKNPPKNRQDLGRFLAEGDLDFTTRLALSRVDVKIPMKSLDLKGFGLRLDADGNILEQHLSLETKIKALRADMAPGRKDTPKESEDLVLQGASHAPQQAIFATGFSGTIDAVNTFAERPKWAELFASARTDVSVAAGLDLLEKDGVAVPGVSAGRISLEVAQEGFRLFELRKLEGNLPEIGLGVLLKGTTSLDEAHRPRDFALDANLSISRAEALHVLPGISSQGGVSASLRVASGDMKKVDITGRLDFQRFGLSIPGQSGTSEPKFVLEELNGTVPIAQSLTVPLDRLLRDKNPTSPIQAASLAVVRPTSAAPGEPNNAPQSEPPNHSDDYRREVAEQAGRYLKRKVQTQSQTASKAPNVDYGSVKAFYPNRKPLTIKRIIAANIEMLEITLDTEWREDMVGMNEFVVGVLGGQLQGNVQMTLANDFERIMAKPRDVASFVRKIHTNIQATRLDTRKILDRLPGAKGGSDRNLSLFSDPYIDATIHFLWNLESRDLGGSMDITTIGKEQVRMLLSYIDPSEEDPTINNIRKSLYLGEVRQVSIPIKNGEIGLDVDIRALSVPIPTPKLSRFPINQLIDNTLRKADKNVSGKGSAT